MCESLGAPFLKGADSPPSKTPLFRFSRKNCTALKQRISISHHESPHPTTPRFMLNTDDMRSRRAAHTPPKHSTAMSVARATNGVRSG